MTDNLLNDNQEDQFQIDETKSYFEELVGENKKFKTVEDLARGKAHSDSLIPILTKRIDNMNEDSRKWRDEAINGAKLQELIDKLSQQQLASNNNTLDVNEASTQKPELDAANLENLISSVFSKKETERKQETNYNYVKSKLEEHYGKNYQPFLKQHMDELGLTDSQLNDDAKNRPKLLLKALGIEGAPKQEESFQPPVRSMRGDNFAPSTVKRTWAYYEKMRKENPAQYYEPTTGNQMQKDAIELGDKFKDGNWGK